MFTGIIEELGAVRRMQPLAAGARIEIRAREVLADLKPGASIAVNGVCLTAVEVTPDWLSADVSPETLERSNLGDLGVGSEINLERPLSPSGRLGGHLVQGHVDGAGEFVSLDPLGDQNWWLRVRLPDPAARYVVEKGSIALDGISLTVARIEAGVVAATVVPHTYAHTNLRARRPGDRINVEYDILAKYVERLLGAARGSAPGLTIEKLREMGY
jgi:riboflavin synthase